MTVKEFIEELKQFPEDMDIVCIGDYSAPPKVSIERYARRDLYDNLIIGERVEIR